MDINYVIPPALRKHTQAIINGVSFAKDALKMTDIRQVNKLFMDVVKNIQAGNIKPTISSIGKYATAATTLYMDALPGAKLAKIPAKGGVDLATLIEKKIVKKGVDVPKNTDEALIALDKKKAKLNEIRAVKKKRKLHIETKEADKMTAEQKMQTYGTNKDFVRIADRMVPIEQTILTTKRHPITNKLEHNWKLKKGYELKSVANKNKAELIAPKSSSKKKEILIPQNPELTAKTDFVAKGSDTPIKHLKGLATKVTDRKGADYIRTKIVQAHSIGEGGLKLPTQYVTNKVNMIPDKFLEELKLPKIFLTDKMNKRHSFLEDGLIQNLVRKYNILGYDVIGKGKWSKPAQKVKLNKAQQQELADIERNIKAYQGKVADINSYVQFYNPVTDKLITHGKPLSEIPGLVSVITKAKRQPGLFLAAGGPVPEDPKPIEETEEVSFVDKMKNVLFPSSFEYPYEVASNEPLERGFIEDIEKSTPEQRIKIYKNIRLQPLEDAIKEFKDKNRTSVTNENLSEEARQYLFSKKTVDDQETLFRSRVNAASMCQPTPDDPWCKAVFPRGVPDILDLAEEFDTFKATDINYKTMTERARGEGLYEETTKKAKQEILANQIKNTPAHVADLMLDFYQILSPPALVSGEMMHLDEIKKGQYVEKEDIGEYVAQVSPGLSEEFKDALIKTYTQMYDDQGLRIVPSGAAGPREPTGWERAKAYGLSAASIGTLFMKPNYVSRIGEVLSRKDIGKWGKTLSIAPKLLGVPSKKEVIGLLKLLKDGAWGTLKAPVKIPYRGGRYLSATVKPGTEGTFYVGNKTLPELGVSLPASELAKRANLTQMIKNIDIILGEMASEKSAERQKISEKEYQSNIANEVRNPQYTNEIKVLYEDALRTKLSDPNEILGEEEDVDVLDMLSKSTDFENLPDWVVRYARDMADDYIDINKLKTSTIGDTLFYDMFNKKKMSVGGDPNDAGMFTDPLRMGDDDTVDIDEYIQGGPYLGIDELDIFEESKKQVPTIPNQQDSIFDDEASFEVAGSIFGSAPGWAVAGVNKVDNLFRAGKTGQRIAQADKIADASKTVGEKINRFYSGLEARLIDPNTPDVFNTPADLFNFLNSKGISKLEAEDYQLPQLIATLAKTNEPITKAKLLDRIKIAPIRNLETKTQGFRSEIINGDGQFVNAKFSNDYYEPGSIPDTYRNTILYIDPKNLPRDVKAYKYSDHGFFPDDEVKYVIGWSRATDRHAIIPGTSKNLPNITPQTEDLTKKITRLERITNTSVEDMIAKSNGRLSVDQATKNLQRAQKDLTKAQEELATVGRTDEAVTGDQTVRITFADEIQSDIFQTYRKHLEQVRDDYQKLLDKGVDVANPTAVQAERYALKTEQDVLEFYNKHKDIMRPIFKTAEDFAAHFTTLKESQKVFKDFAKIKPGTMTQEQLNLVRASGKERDVVLEIFSEAFTNPETLKKLFPNIPFKDRKAWGDAIVKNDLHTAAKRLFIDKDANAAEWYAISPAELIQKRYNQSGTTATALTQRTKDMKGIGTGEFYGGPNVTDPSGKHYTSVLEAALKRAAQINNTEFKIIKVQVSDPKSTKRFINVVDLNGAVVKQFKVGAGDAQDAVTNAM